MIKSRLLWMGALAVWLSGDLAQADNLNIGAENTHTHQSEADLWLDTTFGYCISQVAGETWAEHPAELSGEWEKLGADYASTLIEPLNDPKVSAPIGAVTIDLNEERTSCWVQYDSIVEEYAASRLGEIRDALKADDRLKTAFVDQGHGPIQVAVILVGETRVPVIFYQSASTQAPITTVVTIMQKTVPDFVYYD